MRCPKCRHENRARARFCEECATSLAPKCANCDSQLAPSAKFCPECAHPTGLAAAKETVAPNRFVSPESYTPRHLAERILTSKTSLEGERKQVTVLFADLKGSMELLADRDPEDARKLLDPVIEHMMEAVHRYEGTVNQVMGDGIMALFGAPLAHEDHALRACYAALRMQETVKQYAEDVARSKGVRVQIRVGLNSGEVVVRAIGSDLNMDYTAVGQTTHLAARMEQLAVPGTIVLAPATLQLVEGYVQVEPRGSFAVKGLAEPVETFELTGVSVIRSRLQASAMRGFTRFIGRDVEMDHLRLALRNARNGRGQLVAVVGDPGLGKSRLIYEFTHGEHVQGFRILETGSVSYGKGTTYLPVINLLKAYFTITDNDTPRDIEVKVTGGVMSLDRVLGADVAPILELLDVPANDAQWATLDNQQRRRRTLEALKRLLLRECQVQPLLLVFEDLHWVDSETQSLLDSLVESLPTARMLLFVNYRPEYNHRWGSKTYYTQLRLDALSVEAAGRILEALLGEDPSVGPLKTLLAVRTGNNPLFLEECTRSLLETGVLAGERSSYQLARPIEAIHMPPTVQAILAARIDRLQPKEKALLQAAAVVGKDVPLPLLRIIAEEPEDRLREQLAHLRSAEFLYEAALFPEVEYTFKHALTHEVAYGSLLSERRHALHRAIVAAIEATHESRLAEHVERLSHHAVRGEDWEKAAHYLYQAGQKALARSSGGEAVRYLEDSLSAIDRLPATSSLRRMGIDIRLILRQALRFSANLEGTEALLVEAIRLAQLIDDPIRHARGLAALANLRWQQGQFTAATDCALEAKSLGQIADDVVALAHSRIVLLFSWTCRGDYPQAKTTGRELLELAPRLVPSAQYGHLIPPSIAANGFLAQAHAEQGEFEDAIFNANAAVTLAENLSQPFALTMALYSLGFVHCRLGNLHDAQVVLGRGLDISREWKLEFWVAMISWLLGHVDTEDGKESGLERLKEALDRFERRGMGGFRSLVMADLGEAYLRAKQSNAARETAMTVLERTRQFGERGHEAWALKLLGDVWASASTPEAHHARPHYVRGLELATHLGMRPLAAHCHLRLARLDRRMGQTAQSQANLSIALAMYREMNMQCWLRRSEEWAQLA